MASIYVNQDKCIKDSFCIRECPMKIIRKDCNGYPEYDDNAGDKCIDCGHCVAICPHKAIALNNHKENDYEDVLPELQIDKKQMTQLIKSRRSVRQFKKQAVAKDKIIKLLDSVRWAPSAINAQPVNWIVVDGNEATHKIAQMVADWMEEKQILKPMFNAWNHGNDCILRDAPNLLIAHAKESGFDPVIDCSIATTTFELAASVENIGACWAGIFIRAANDHKPLSEFLNVPEGNKICSALMFGYPKFKYPRIPTRNKSNVSWI